MKHLFDVELAEAYGIDVAVFIENLSFWIVKNQANKEHLHDGRYWTYNTLDAFTTIFPYFTKKQIRRIIDKSLSFDLIVKGNYNQIGYDRTIWYSLSDKGHAIFDLCLCPDGPIQMPKRAHQNVQTGTPIPDINTDNKPYIKDNKAQRTKRVDAVIVEPIILPDWLDQDSWNNFIQHRKEIGKPLKPTGIKMAIKRLKQMKENGQDIVLVIEYAISNGYQGLFEIKSQGEHHGKDSKYYGKNGKFDSMQYLLDSVREDEERKFRESKENNYLSEGELSSEDSKYLQYDGTSVFSY